jgi:hypothetical protein
MAAQTRLISNGTSIYLANHANTPYSGFGSPWDTQDTSPFELSLNDVTGNIWTPAPAPDVSIYGGGPPLRNGRDLLVHSYDDVTESVGVQIRAAPGNGNTALDNAAALLRLLRRTLNTTIYGSPCILAFQANGNTKPTYYTISKATVSESPNYIVESTADLAILRLTITWTRSIGFADAPETIVNAQTIQNRSTSTPNNVLSTPITHGDLIYEGQPLNITIEPFNGAKINTLFIASVLSRTNVAVGVSRTTSHIPPNSIDFDEVQVTITPALYWPVSIRVIGYFDTLTNPDKALSRIILSDDYGGSSTLQHSAFVPITKNASIGTVTSSIVDFGVFDPRPLRETSLVETDDDLKIRIEVDLASSDGTSVTARMVGIDVILYSTFATITFPDSNVSDDEKIRIEMFSPFNVTNASAVGATLWTPTPPRVYSQSPPAYSGISNTPVVRGSLPVALAQRSLYIAWHGVLSYSTSDQAVVTVKHLPLYHSLRGNE